jgi:formylglycine-generating enzyme required for sulfatase activity
MTLRKFLSVPSLIGVLGASAGCSAAAPARPELVVFVDTDAHVVGELTSRPEVSDDAAMDLLRVDVLDESNAIYASNSFVVSEVSNWPVSFGVVPAAEGPAEVRLRIRLFRATFAREGYQNGDVTLDPPPEVTLERLVSIGVPTAGVMRVRVLLSADCLGVRSSFATPLTTCLDQSDPAVDPQLGVQTLTGAPPSSPVGSWPSALEQPCSVAPGPDQVCILGGFSIVGDYDAVGDTQSEVYIPGVGYPQTAPLRPVLLRPFLMDKTEFSVKRLRALAQSSALSSAALPKQAGSGSEPFCDWLGPDDPSNDGLPLNCVSDATALAACAASGGTLPTEAQWEHAARGRGERRRYPWGNQSPACCALSASRPPDGAECEGAGSGPEAIGSHQPSSACNGLGDQSRDGVLDMAGSLSEALLDELADYGEPCWSGGILHDPVCSRAASGVRAERGDNWSGGLGNAWVVLRHEYAPFAQDGFRCVYPGDSR